MAPGRPTLQGRCVLLLHGWGWPVGAGVVELDLRLGGAARQARPFLIWQTPIISKLVRSASAELRVDGLVALCNRVPGNERVSIHQRFSSG